MGLKNSSFPLIFLCCLLLTSFIFCSKAEDDIEEEDHGHATFSYDTEAENGPHNWGNLKPEWKLCGVGKRQSPINIIENYVVTDSTVHGDLTVKYKPADAIIKREHHEVLVEWEKDAGGIIINNTEFKLSQCHWHTPTEHTFDLQRYEVELHLLHQNTQGDKAVIGILYNLGASDPFLAMVLPHLISNQTHLGEVNPSWIGLDERDYYRYKGSLTTPPCTENVTWTVLKMVRTVSQEQVVALRAAIQDGHIGNARPLQALNG